MFFIEIGIFLFITGLTVGGYKTLAPKCDNSIASLYDKKSIGCDCLTIFGLAVNIPLTSVHISNFSAFATDASIDAEKSEPPLPRVTLFPKLSLAINPGMKIKLFLTFL